MSQDYFGFTYASLTLGELAISLVMLLHWCADLFQLTATSVRTIATGLLAQVLVHLGVHRPQFRARLWEPRG